MAGFFNDTSGLDATAFNGSSNNAASDYGRQSMANPEQFKSPLAERLLGGPKSPRQATPAATAPAAAPYADTPPHAAPAAATEPAPAISSGGSLVGRILRSAAGPASYDAQGKALVPGTPFTPEEFAQKIMSAQAPPAPPPPVAGPLPPFQGIPQFRGPEPPNRQVPPSSSSWWKPETWFNPTDGVAPAAPPLAADAQQPASQFGGNRFGGAQFGGNRFGGRRFGPDGLPGYTPLGFFRGGDVQHFRRGGYPQLMGGLPMRDMATGGDYVPPDGMGDGRSDHVDAKLSPGEFVQDAETVALLGNGDNSAGARGMEAIREAIRRDKGNALAKGKFSPDAKSPEHYARVGMKAAARRGRR